MEMAALSGDGAERQASLTLSGLAGPGAPGMFGSARWAGWHWLRLFFSAIWLVYLAQPLSSLSHLHHGVLWVTAAVAVTAAFCVLFIVVVTSWDHHPAVARWGLVALFALAAIFSLMFSRQGSGGRVVWIYVSSATGWVVPERRVATRAVLGVTACYLLFREAISGYRRPTLAVEVVTARTALETAGIMPYDDPEITLLSGTFDPDTEAALAWCLREAVTNVVRHSQAGNCRITLSRRADTLSLEIRDDGCGTGSDDITKHTTGTGLHGMSERLRRVGGRLELRPGPRGFCLIASVPVRNGATVSV